MKPGEARHYELPSRLDTLGALRAEVRALALEHGFSLQAADDFELCIHEAVSNAMVHGHGLDATRLVHVAVEAERQALRATVSDSGPGFDVVATLKDLSSAGEEPRGRGLRIISTLSDSPQWVDQGRRLIFTKQP
ncbi:MAG: ATP-binding protein [Armatimonadetes bacterium]|nr:ATP-binding protein [Armatimonadota bacterium]